MALLTVDEDPSALRRLNSEHACGRHTRPNFQSLRRPDGPIKISPVRNSVRASEQEQTKPDRPDAYVNSTFGKRMDSKRFPGKQKRFKCFKLFPSPLKLLFAKSKRLCKFIHQSKLRQRCDPCFLIRFSFYVHLNLLDSSYTNLRFHPRARGVIFDTDTQEPVPVCAPRVVYSLV